MARLTWDDTGSREFEAGVSNGVLFVRRDVPAPIPMEQQINPFYENTVGLYNHVNAAFTAQAVDENGTGAFFANVLPNPGVVPGITVPLFNLNSGETYRLSFKFQVAEGAFKVPTYGVCSWMLSSNGDIQYTDNETWATWQMLLGLDYQIQQCDLEFIAAPNETNGAMFLLFRFDALMDDVMSNVHVTDIRVTGLVDSEYLTNYYHGVAWNGLINVDSKSDGGEPVDIWMEDYKFDTLRAPEVLTGTIEAYTYPVEFAQCDGSYIESVGVYVGQQPRKRFAFAYKSYIGSDIDPSLTHYKLHIVYNASASPSDRSYESINDSSEVQQLAWDFTTVPVETEGYEPISEIIIDSRFMPPQAMRNIEDSLYGTSLAPGSLFEPGDFLSLV